MPDIQDDTQTRPPLPLSGAIQPSTASTAALNNGVYSPALVNDLYTGQGFTPGGGGVGTGGGAAGPYLDRQSDFSTQMRGVDPSGRLGALQQARHQSGDFKQQRIQEAMAILAANRQGQTTNLPLLAAAGAMLAPTKTGNFAESLGAGMTAAVQPTETDRTRDTALAGAMGRLGIEDADVPLALASADTGDFWKQMEIAEKAGSSAAIGGVRTDVANTQADARKYAADAAAEARKAAAKERADALKEAARIRADAPPAAAKLYEFATQSHPDGKGGWTDPMDPVDALSLLDPRRIGNDPAAYARAVAAQRKILADDNAMHGNKLSAEELDKRATETVTRIYGLTPNPRRTTPGTTPAPADTTPPAPAGATQPAPATTAPTTGPRAATPDEIAKAKAAIKNGAPKTAVIQRFKENNVTLPDLGG